MIRLSSNYSSLLSNCFLATLTALITVRYCFTIPVTTASKLNHEHMRFIYTDVPVSQIDAARRLGQLARLAFENSLKESQTKEDRQEKQGEYLSQCAKLGISEHETTTSSSVIDSMPELIMNTRRKTIKNLVNAIGVDPMVGEIYELSGIELVEKITTSCQRNEIQFQCAYGFFNDLTKIRAYIEALKEEDGTFKVMAEQECKIPEEELNRSSVYTCVNENTETIWNQCQTQIETYNRTRHNNNLEMQSIFDSTIDRIDELAQQAISNGNQEALSKVLKEGDQQIIKTLQDLTKVEAYKCRQFIPMERCILNILRPKCDPGVAESLSTILRTGYLQRERGMALHQQFLEGNVEPARACNRVNT